MQKRLKHLIYKLFGLNGFIWMTATVLVWNAKISGEAWVAASAACGLWHTAKKHKDLGGYNGSTDVPNS